MLVSKFEKKIIYIPHFWLLLMTFWDGQLLLCFSCISRLSQKKKVTVICGDYSSEIQIKYNQVVIRSQVVLPMRSLSVHD